MACREDVEDGHRVILQKTCTVDLKEIITITTNPSIDRAAVLAEHLERAEPDLLRSLLKAFVEALMGAEADAVCGAPYRARSEERVNSRNGYRPREWDTRAGTVEVAIPKLGEGSYFADWLLKRRKRAERALTTVVVRRGVGCAAERRGRESLARV